MTTQTSTVDVVIVGGGIGGLSSALALTRAGQRVRVLEQAPAFGEVGAGMQMAPNATRILRSWGLLGEVVNHGVVPRRLVMRDAVDGTDLSHLDLAATRDRYGAPYVVIHRSDLHAILVRACRAAGVDMVNNTAVIDVENGDRQAVAVSAARRDVGQLVLAADGLNSRLRRHVHQDEPVSSAYVAYRGAVPMSEVGDDPRIAPDDLVVYLGPDCHLVQYPLRGGEMFNQVAVFRSPRALAGEPDWGTPQRIGDGVLEHLRRGACRSGAPVARPPVEDVRPGADHHLDAGQAGADRRCRSPHVAVPRTGRVPGHRGRGQPRHAGQRPLDARRSRLGPRPPSLHRAAHGTHRAGPAHRAHLGRALALRRPVPLGPQCAADRTGSSRLPPHRLALRRVKPFALPAAQQTRR
jgi:2-polyprenyl-6-methoxyphenol hydroxylase-like FAD-dependent oxidoreductase